ncbi:putative uncharacterized protein [Clostridium sp. CAG:149]|nr:putative uncharacterized protein [Clostridium sp. CAG:149]
MRKSKFTAAAVIMGIAVTGLAITGCAGKTEPAETTAAQETAKMEELQPAETAESMEETEGTEETEAKTEAAEEETKSESAEAAGKPQAEAQAENGSAGGYEDNFAVDSAAAAEFAAQIKEAVAAKDLDALEELTAFPVYVGLPDVGAVETKEDFLALGADAVFTDELVTSVANADTENMKPSMAGFSISDGGKANINFGVRDGVLAVSGINY